MVVKVVMMMGGGGLRWLREERCSMNTQKQTVAKRDGNGRRAQALMA